MKSNPQSYSRTTLAIARRTIALSVTACAFVGCESEESISTDAGHSRLSHAANNIQDQGAWSLENTDMEERWDQDPTIMEPDYPSAGQQPGFGP
ncbi:MAG: hypothetical protein EXS15_04175 [Phycisphaerales bacterium]|nr:hypothetical protein [Phycisphaerales bacterium]